jgi:peptide chain release factor 1
VKLNDKDLKVETMRASGAGGQHVNTTDSAVRITHLPTGIVVAIQDERSQHQNRAKAMKILRAKIYEKEKERVEKERAAARKSQIGSAERHEKIRTYNFPQDRVTDHRCNVTFHGIDKMMTGELLVDVSQALELHHQAIKLENFDID